MEGRGSLRPSFLALQGIGCVSYFPVRNGLRVTRCCGRGRPAEAPPLAFGLSIGEDIGRVIGRTRAVSEGTQLWSAVQAPRLRVQRLIRSILEVRRDDVTRPVMKATLTKAVLCDDLIVCHG